MSFLECHFEQVETVSKGYVHLRKAAQKSSVSVRLILELLFGHHLKHVCCLKGEGVCLAIRDHGKDQESSAGRVR